MNNHPLLKELDNAYKQWQSYAEKTGHEQLLAKAVCWSYNSKESRNPGESLTDEERWNLARRTIAFQTSKNVVVDGLKPEELWQILLG